MYVTLSVKLFAASCSRHCGPWRSMGHALSHPHSPSRLRCRTWRRGVHPMCRRHCRSRHQLFHAVLGVRGRLLVGSGGHDMCKVRGGHVRHASASADLRGLPCRQVRHQARVGLIAGVFDMRAREVLRRERDSVRGVPCWAVPGWYCRAKARQPRLVSKLFQRHLCSRGFIRLRHVLPRQVEWHGRHYLCRVPSRDYNTPTQRTQQRIIAVRAVQPRVLLWRTVHRVLEVRGSLQRMC